MSPTHCTQCGMLLSDAGEYHPYVFCILKKAGQDPWQTVERLASDLGLGEPPPQPPLVRHLELFRTGK